MPDATGWDFTRLAAHGDDDLALAIDRTIAFDRARPWPNVFLLFLLACFLFDTAVATA